MSVRACGSASNLVYSSLIKYVIRNESMSVYIIVQSIFLDTVLLVSYRTNDVF